MSRPDRTITYLKKHGYCVVRLPRSDIRPLQTLIRTGKKDLQLTGELRDIMSAGSNPLPDISFANAAPLQISGEHSSATKLEVGLDILENIIAALGGSQASLKAGFKNARNLTFRFENVLEDHADINRIDQFLATASIRPDQRSVKDALIDDRVYVVNSTIKTATFTITASTDNGVNASLDIPELQQAAGGDLKVDASRAGNGVVSYSGSVPVVFGFQAVRLIFDDDTQTYAALNPLEAGQAAAKAIGDVTPDFLTLDEGVFFRVHDSQ